MKTNAKPVKATCLTTGTQRMFPSIRIAAHSMGANEVCISCCARGKQSSHMGHTWRFASNKSEPLIAPSIMRHKWVEVIKAFLDGKTVQFRYPSVYKGDWQDKIGFNMQCFDLDYLEWRIKPEPVKLKYRRYIRKMDGNLVVTALPNDIGYKTPKRLEDCSHFIRWIDTEWQEVEV